MDPLIMKGMEAKLDKLPSKEKFQAPNPRKAFQVSILFSAQSIPSKVLPGEPVFRQAAIEAGESVWKKGLLKKIGLCHGVSGNAYTFLALYRLTKEELYLTRAKAFAGFLYNNGRKLIASGEMHGGDHPYSLFEGLAGTACLYFDMVKPEHSRFPGFEL